MKILMNYADGNRELYTTADGKISRPYFEYFSFTDTNVKWAGKRIYSIIFFLLVFINPTFAQQTFFISPSGNDKNTGTVMYPFQSLERARDTVRTAKFKNNDTILIYLRSGYYDMDHSFELDSRDSGDSLRPIIYRAFQGESVHIVGGRRILSFHHLGARDLPENNNSESRKNLVEVNLPSQGITDFGQLKPRGYHRALSPAALELFFNGKRMTLARWPNFNWAIIDSVPQGGQSGSFFFHDRRIKRWVGLDDVWIHGYWNWDWADSHEHIKSIDSVTWEMKTFPPNGVYGYNKGKRFYVYNILSELDTLNEWYLDRKTGALYFWPPSLPDTTEIYVSVLQVPFIILKNVHDVRFENLILEYCRGVAAQIIDGKRNTFVGCTLRNIGNVAVQILGGSDNGVQSCDIYFTGDGAIQLTGGDRTILTSASNYAENNLIYNYASWDRTYQPAILIEGVGNKASHNLIYNAPHTAILITGNNHIIEYNDIHDVGQETGDVGAFYMGRDWTARGNIIRYNYFHSIHSQYQEGAMSVYLDDMASGATIYGNIFSDVTNAVFIGGGRDNTVQNNIFINCQPAIHLDNRGVLWKSFEKGGANQVFEKLQSINYKQSPYSIQYPQLSRILDEDPRSPRGNKIINNISFGGTWHNVWDKLDTFLVIQGNQVNMDPKFLSIIKNDFSFIPDSNAYRMGFRVISFDSIGLYNDKFRIYKRRNINAEH